MVHAYLFRQRPSWAGSCRALPPASSVDPKPAARIGCASGAEDYSEHDAEPVQGRPDAHRVCTAPWCVRYITPKGLNRVASTSEHDFALAAFNRAETVPFARRPQLLRLNPAWFSFWPGALSWQGFGNRKSNLLALQRCDPSLRSARPHTLDAWPKSQKERIVQP